MKGEQFRRLVDNIRADGCLTSLPLVASVDGRLTVVSGTHRVSAAIQAGIAESNVIEVISPLTRQQFVALQLSHNAIVGQDDPNKLRELYEELDFGWKEYSGLTDEAFAVQDLDASSLHVEQPQYEELRISFLPADKEVVLRWLDALGKIKSHPVAVVGRYEDFSTFFDGLLRVKQVKNVHNTALALRLMAELAGSALSAAAEKDDNGGAEG